MSESLRRPVPGPFFISQGGSGGGFSLMELLVVVAIIGILAALLLPALSGAMDRARSASCKNRLHEMGMALQMYVHENGNRYPNRGIWYDDIFPHYSLAWSNRAYHCPGYPRTHYRICREPAS